MLILEFFETLSLAYPHPAVFSAPAAIGLFCNSCLPAGFCYGDSLIDESDVNSVAIFLETAEQIMLETDNTLVSVAHGF